MSNPVISVRDLGKQYRLGTRQSYKTLRDALASLPRYFERQKQDRKNDATTWALQDINLDIGSGEVLGIIGRNGSGKSTFLKILAKITQPTTGRAEVRGRIGSLLEVGTGFHPELTGRENIFVNGAIIGMSRSEIARKFDQIVDFSGVETFLDTPVKRYSSGMRLRLAFATAAHLEPEILLIDEVLAVGDAEFQRKCIGRMRDVASEGRTSLFVSHQMDAVNSLCSRAIWLAGGRLQADGPAEEIVKDYLASTMAGAKGGIEDRTDRQGEGPIKATALEVRNRGSDIINVVTAGRSAEFAIKYVNEAGNISLGSVAIFVAVRDSFDRLITTIDRVLSAADVQKLPLRGCFWCDVETLPLVPGNYTLEYSIRVNGDVSDKLFRAVHFEVVSGSNSEGTYRQARGVILLQQCWREGADYAYV